MQSPLGVWSIYPAGAQFASTQVTSSPSPINGLAFDVKSYQLVAIQGNQTCSIDTATGNCTNAMTLLQGPGCTSGTPAQYASINASTLHPDIAPHERQASVKAPST